MTITTQLHRRIARLFAMAFLLAATVLPMTAGPAGAVAKKPPTKVSADDVRQMRSCKKGAGEYSHGYEYTYTTADGHKRTVRCNDGEWQVIIVA